MICSIMSLGIFCFSSMPSRHDRISRLESFSLESMIVQLCAFRGSITDIGESRFGLKFFFPSQWGEDLLLRVPCTVSVSSWFKPAANVEDSSVRFN